MSISLPCGRLSMRYRGIRNDRTDNKHFKAYFHWYGYHNCSYYWTARYPDRRANCSISQHIRTKRNHAGCFYDLRDFCLLPDRRAVPAHTEKNGREPYLAGDAIRLCLLRSVDRLPLGASAPCGSLGSHHLSCGGRPGSHRHGAAAGLAVRANKAACKKAQSEAARPSRTYHTPLLYSRAAASVLRYRYLFVLPRKNCRDPVMVPAGRFCDCLRYGVAEPLCGR